METAMLHRVLLFNARPQAENISLLPCLGTASIVPFKLWFIW